MMDVIERARALRPIIVKAMEGVDDSTAAKAGELFDRWKKGEAVKAGYRRYYPPTGKLYKVKEGHDHTTQADWTPDVTPALWEVIDVSHAGTLEDPIPATAGMLYIKGKYYSEVGKESLYLCIRQDTEEGTVLQYVPSELIGIYFEEV